MCNQVVRDKDRGIATIFVVMNSREQITSVKQVAEEYTLK